MKIKSKFKQQRTSPPLIPSLPDPISRRVTAQTYNRENRIVLQQQQQPQLHPKSPSNAFKERKIAAYRQGLERETPTHIFLPPDMPCIAPSVNFPTSLMTVLVYFG
jgi:hypothetical protein